MDDIVARDRGQRTVNSSAQKNMMQSPWRAAQRHVPSLAIVVVTLVGKFSWHYANVVVIGHAASRPASQLSQPPVGKTFRAARDTRGGIVHPAR